MKNKEFYKDQLIEIALQYGRIAKVNNQLVPCNTTPCYTCDWYQEGGLCLDKIQKWANEEFNNNLFDFDLSDKYYFVNADGNVTSNKDFYFDFDRGVIKFGNACKYKGYMERRAKEIRLYNLLSNFAYQVNDGWEPDWESKYQNKWYIYKMYSQEWAVTWHNQIQCVNEVYFKTEELARRAIEEVIIPFEKEFCND